MGTYLPILQFVDNNDKFPSVDVTSIACLPRLVQFTGGVERPEPLDDPYSPGNHLTPDEIDVSNNNANAIFSRVLRLCILKIEHDGVVADGKKA